MRLQNCRQVECILLIIIFVSVSVSGQTGTTVRRACQKSFLLTMCISPGNEDPGLGSRGEWRKAGTRVPDDQQVKLSKNGTYPTFQLIQLTRKIE